MMSNKLRIVLKWFVKTVIIFVGLMTIGYSKIFGEYTNSIWVLGPLVIIGYFLVAKLLPERKDEEEKGFFPVFLFTGPYATLGIILGIIVSGVIIFILFGNK